MNESEPSKAMSDDQEAEERREPDRDDGARSGIQGAGTG